MAPKNNRTVPKMPEKIKIEQEKRKKSSNTFTSLRKFTGKFSRDAEKEYKVIIYKGNKLVKQIDKRLDKAKNKTRDALKKLMERTKKTIKKMIAALPKSEDENDLGLYE